MKNKTLYVGNHSKVGGIIGEMPIPSGLEGKGLELQTKALPYGVTINYLLSDATEAAKESALSSEAYYRNSILLLCLIDNVDSITYSIVENTDQNDGETYTFTFTREQADKLLGEDVRRYSSDETSLRKLIDRLNNLTFQ